MSDTADRSGMEILQDMSQGNYPGPTISQIIPMRIVLIEPGHVQFWAKAGCQHLNPLGGVHGGFAATVLDSATGCAVHSMLEAGVGYATIDLAIKMLKPVPKDEDLLADGKLIHLSTRLGVSEGTLKDGQGRILAYAT
ncbi:PaaI family thioesterase, partial [Desulfosarcina sp. OttesenSCG-928-A07]|nr:PaaI family thioesterase [Desulfosarcina sp. OttesenSCG-928-A07]